MKTYTAEEKEQIMRMPIGIDSFERPSFNYDDFSEENYGFLCKYIDVYPETESYEYDRAGRRYMFEWGFLSTPKYDQRKAKMQFAKSGGTARGNAITNRITIPTSWVKSLGITEEDRNVTIKLIDNKIVIEKGN